MMESPFLPMNDSAFPYQVCTGHNSSPHNSSKKGSPNRTNNGEKRSPRRARPRRSAWEDLAEEYATKTAALAKDHKFREAAFIKVDWKATKEIIIHSPGRHQPPTRSSPSSPSSSKRLLTFHSDGSPVLVSYELVEATTASSSSDGDDHDHDDDESSYGDCIEHHGTPTPRHPEEIYMKDSLIPRQLFQNTEEENSRASLPAKKMLEDKMNINLAIVLLVMIGMSVSLCYWIMDFQFHNKTTSLLTIDTTRNSPRSTDSSNASLEILPKHPFQKTANNTAADAQQQQQSSISRMMGTSVALSNDAEIMVIGGATSSVANNDELQGWARIYSTRSKLVQQKDATFSLGNIFLEETSTFNKRDTMICYVSLSSEGNCLVTGWGGQIRLFQETAGSYYTEDSTVNSLFANAIKAPDGSISSVAISNDCCTLVVAADDAIYVATRSEWTQRWRMESVFPIGMGGGSTNNSVVVRSFARVSLSSNAKRLSIGSLSEYSDGNTNKELHVINRSVFAGEWLTLGKPLVFHNQTWQTGDLVAMSEDGATVAVGCQTGNNTTRGGTVLVYSYESIGNSWQPLGQALEGELGFGVALSLSSDGKCLAVRGSDGLFVTYTFDSKTARWSQFGESFYSSSIASHGAEDAQDTKFEHWAYPKVTLSGGCDWVAIGDPSPMETTGRAHMFQV